MNVLTMFLSTPVLVGLLVLLCLAYLYYRCGGLSLALIKGAGKRREGDVASILSALAYSPSSLLTDESIRSILM